MYLCFTFGVPSDSLHLGGISVLLEEKTGILWKASQYQLTNSNLLLLAIVAIVINLTVVKNIARRIK